MIGYRYTSKFIIPQSIPSCCHKSSIRKSYSSSRKIAIVVLIALVISRGNLTMTTKQPNQARKSPPPIVFMALIGLIGVGTYQGIQSFRGNRPSAPIAQPKGDSTPISSGAQALFHATTTAKQDGITAFGQKQYESAIAAFKASLTQQPNDPETRIYLNNATARLGNPIKLAVVVPIGADINLAQEVLRGVAQAQEEANNVGGINGKTIEITIADDNNNETTAQTVAQKLGEQSDILGVIGHTASNVTLKVASIYDQQKLVMISPISSAVQLSNRSPYIFRTLPSDYVAARALANHMLAQQQHKKAVIFFNSQSEYSKSLKQEFSTAVSLGGGQIVDEYDLTNSGFSASKSLDRAKQQGAQTIMLASNTSSLDRALQIVQQNRNQLTILAGDDVYSPKTLDIGREKALNMVVAVPWHILGDPTATFPARSRQLWGGDVNWRTVTAYDATQALISGLKQNPTRSGVKTALVSENFTAAGASGPVKFLPSGDRNMGVQLVKVVPGNRAGYGFDFEPLR
jgi:branched-chain amino acid transport system substrate-binding protein